MRPGCLPAAARRPLLRLGVGSPDRAIIWEGDSHMQFRTTPHYRFVGALSVVIVSIISLSSAQQDSVKGVYVGGTIGPLFVNAAPVDDDFGNHFDATFDTGLTAGGLGGYDFGRFRADEHARAFFTNIDRFRASGSSFRAHGDVQVVSLLANGWYDFENKSSVTPYAGAGIGLASIYVSDIRVQGSAIYGADTTTVFAFQVGGGVTFSLSPRFLIDVGFQHFRTSDPSFEIARTEFKSNLLVFSARYLLRGE